MMHGVQKSKHFQPCVYHYFLTVLHRDERTLAWLICRRYYTHINPQLRHTFRAWISNLLVMCLKWCFASSNCSQTPYTRICTAFIWMQTNRIMPTCCMALVVCHVLRHCGSFILECSTHEDEGTKVQHLKTWGTTRPVERHNIPQDLHFLKYCCGNLIYWNY
jgi:hypothetical protein